MKTSSVTAVICLAASAMSSPVVVREEQGTNDLFGGNEGGRQTGNPIGNIVGTALCFAGGVVSTFIGKGPLKCSGTGNVAVHKQPGDGNTSPPSASAGQYTYTYTTNADGTLKVVITLKGNGAVCTHDSIKADPKQDIHALVAEEAKKCVAEKGGK
ncbi:hypothetical protein NLG97_g8730 [Lecanicillium saksenae]|uniref:Uncharacterized protein n=1 Tax=Lecanicillium saksenae TaxID=468837 RepID=A0ACC1QKQ3_9HYPO|nr:hypothetical protein NLG97_g8730 [Lecanicillium saksenae]